MGRFAPVLPLLVLTACAADPTPPARPPVVPPPAPVARATPPHSPPTTVPQGGYVQEIDELFRALADDEAEAGPARLAPAAGSTSPAAVYAIPRATREIPAADPYGAVQAAYRENLATCLDGRFPAFCDHEQLTDHDSARAREAEYQANLVTCIDPEWQHLCRPDLLPEYPDPT